MDETATSITNKTRIIREKRYITNNTFVLRFDRGDLQFRAGQYISVGLQGSLHHREYSIYSGEQDDYLEILVREVAGGNVSWQLKNSEPGMTIDVHGPFGFMIMNEKDIFSKKFVFVATGTGIAPFRSFTRSYPGMNYLLVHGIRNNKEFYDKQDYGQDNYLACVSGETSHMYQGRVTDYFQEKGLSPDRVYYLCGNSSMIYEVNDLLRKNGVPQKNIHYEVYF